METVETRWQEKLGGTGNWGTLKTWALGNYGPLITRGLRKLRNNGNQWDTGN